MSGRALAVLERVLPLAVGAGLLLLLGSTIAVRAGHPFDLEWTEGGTLAHAWRLQRHLPLYVVPGPDFVPFDIPPGYPAILSALGKIFGLSPLLGRIVSIVSIGAAAAAAAAVVRRAGAPLRVALCAAVIFLGAYPHVGASYDLVRPDSLGLALLGWAVALGLDARRGAEVASGLLLCAATLVQHTLAGFALPMALGIGLMQGWRAAGRFLGVALIPTGALGGWWQWRSDGAFLAYLVEVPASQPRDWGRAWLAVPRELGTPLPLAVGAIGLWAVLSSIQRQRGIGPGICAILGVWSGMISAFLGTYRPPPPDSGLYNAPSAVAFWALGTIPVATGLWLLGAGLQRRRGAAPSGRALYGLGIGCVALIGAAALRARGGGLLGAYLPLPWCLAVGLGCVCGRWLAQAPTPWVRALVAGGLTTQLSWSVILFDRAAVVPTSADLDAGRRVLSSLLEVEGPVLSPYAAWLPVYLGRPPSLHHAGVWSIEAPSGPFVHELASIEGALRGQRWARVVGSDRRFLEAFYEAYEPARQVVDPRSDLLRPKTGWDVQPWRLWRPKISPPRAPAG
ncbi:MAG TPA: hypothetical protein ENK18_00620 [Deltaproteobacteria bacterium]|nr:hypothetical protein [Deltaproteobacteria bacterium]